MMMNDKNFGKKTRDYDIATSSLVTAIYDCVAKRYLGITVEQSQAEAMRNFKVACNTQGTLIHASKEDFELRCLGMINMNTGKIVPIEPIDVLMRGVDIDVS